MIRLEPMDEATFAAWREASVDGYAREKVEAGTWLVGESRGRAEREFEVLLPGGRDTPGHAVRSVVNGAGERVGVVWFVPEDRPFGRVVFIYDIAIEPAHRRRGYAQAALAEIEVFARAHGCIGVQLHVLGGNAAARQLYQRVGFIETDVTMLKRVDG